MKSLDKHAPEKEKVTIIRPTLPWFTSETNSLKAICRKMERRWRANKNKESEHIYKSVRHVYRKHLRYNKHKYINSAIQDCGQDMSKMYKFMFTLLGKSKDNPMPPSDSDALLADEFASFFMEKIVKIRKDLEQFDLYDPHMCRCSLQQFEQFDPVSEEEVLKVISNAKPTTCPTDPIP